jgi:hypothetical protein
MIVFRGLLAGALAALTFQQGALFLLSLARLVPPPSLGAKADPSQVLPGIASAALWGAAWGFLLAPLLRRPRPEAAYWIKGAVLGAVLPTAAAWAIAVALAQTAPDDPDWLAAAVAVVVNGAWGFGAALLLPLF